MVVPSFSEVGLSCAQWFVVCRFRFLLCGLWLWVWGLAGHLDFTPRGAVGQAFHKDAGRRRGRQGGKLGSRVWPKPLHKESRFYASLCSVVFVCAPHAFFILLCPSVPFCSVPSVPSVFFYAFCAFFAVYAHLCSSMPSVPSLPSLPSMPICALLCLLCLLCRLCPSVLFYAHLCSSIPFCSLLCLLCNLCPLCSSIPFCALLRLSVPSPAKAKNCVFAKTGTTIFGRHAISPR